MERSKLIVKKAYESSVPVISSMGAGNKLDPTRFEITDINKTSVCPLAKVMRKELKQRGIKKLKVLYSKEESIKLRTPYNNDLCLEKENSEIEESTNQEKIKKQTPGSISFVPSVAGLIIAGEVVKDLIK